MTLRRFFRKLRLRQGDVLLVNINWFQHNTWKDLLEGGKNARLPFSVPILVIDKKNEIQCLPFEKLEKFYLEAKRARDKN